MNPHPNIVAGVAALLAALTSLLHMPPVLLWNASPSAPEGLYLLALADRLTVGQLVAARPDSVLEDLMARRGYLPRGVPLLKHIAALPGQQVCRKAISVTIDGRHVADALERDRQGRPLSSWQGCFSLSDGNVFLLNADVPDSFDGRYFGPTSASSIIGIAVPLWTTATTSAPATSTSETATSEPFTNSPGASP